MAVTFTVLASGSQGNCTVLSTSTTRLLVDAGISCREACKRMRANDVDPERLTAIIISHEHSDHIAGLRVMAKKLKIPVYMTGDTNDAWGRNCGKEATHLERLELFYAGHRFQIGDISVLPFTIPHDAVDPVGFTFQAEGLKIGVATDLGYMPTSVRQHLRGCDILMIESNHDLEMLRGGPYPWSVKQRVMSRVGHLSNDALAEFLTSDYDGGAAYLILAHLSEQNNHPEIARGAAERALIPKRNLLTNRLMLATQEAGLAPLQM
jgi:phosphoribosyl 1,2-cyclic phosphodiesterase